MEALLPPASPDFAAFGSTLRGHVILPGDAAYDDARKLHDPTIDRRPAAIVRVADAQDVARTIRFARASGLELAVRSGGHSIPGHSMVDDGVVIDTTELKSLHIDPAAKVAWAGAGLTAGEYTKAAAEFGLATPFGDSPSVGIAGLTLGGGIGYLVRKHGLAIDSLLAVELVTADGRIVNASADENQDLFWAVRGGGGNFGVVTRFRYRLHDVGMVYGGALVLPLTKETVRGLVDLGAAGARGADDHRVRDAPAAAARRAAGGGRHAVADAHPGPCRRRRVGRGGPRARSARWRSPSSTWWARCRTRRSTS